MKKKILVVTPRSPFADRGACEADRLAGIKWFLNHGYEVRVITKYLPSDVESIVSAQNTLGIKISPVPYKYSNIRGIAKLLHYLRRIIWPLYWDGASYEYYDREISGVLKKELMEFKPDYVWFDYTYLWPLYRVVRKNSQAKIITRSINFEPKHFLDENGRNILNYTRVVPKFISEVISFRISDYFFSITPNEEKIYKRFGKTELANLPLRSLAERVNRPLVQKKSDEKIKIGFMPSTFSVPHNLEALKFILKDILPLLPKEIIEKIYFHFTGNKLPIEIKDNLPSYCVYEGFVPSSIDFWLGMDIALAPSVFGAGMQQKIFEPLALGIPTVTSRRGLAGYDFKCGESVMCAETKEDYVSKIKHFINNYHKLDNYSNEAKTVSKELFSSEAIDSIINKCL